MTRLCFGDTAWTKLLTYDAMAVEQNFRPVAERPGGAIRNQELGVGFTIAMPGMVNLRRHAVSGLGSVGTEYACEEAFLPDKYCINERDRCSVAL